MKTRSFAAAAALVALLGLAACNEETRNQEIGGITGAVIGGIVGSHIGSGSGRDIAIGTGAMIGALMGASIGAALDEQAAQSAENAQIRALNAPLGESIQWDAPDNASGPAYGVVVANRQGVNDGGQTCREYRHEVTIGDDTETLIGIACQNGDGTWTAVN